MTDTTTEPEIIESIKGFDKNLQCRGFQFELGKSYEHDGPVEVCRSGFHAVEGNPLDVFGYYPPAESRYATTQQSGAVSRCDDGSKVASTKITIDVKELHLHELIQRAVKWVFDRATKGSANETGYQSTAASTGCRSTAASTGYWSTAMSSGYMGAVMGADGCALFLVHRDDYNITHAWAGIVGRNGIKTLTWYRLDSDGIPQEIDAS